MTKRFFSYSENGIEFHATAEEAKASAQADVNTYKDDANHDGEWSGDIDLVLWGEVRESAQEVPHGEGTCDYTLRAIELGHAAEAQAMSKEFERGALIAVSLLIELYGHIEEAAVLINALSLNHANCSQINDHDKIQLSKLQSGDEEGLICFQGLQTKPVRPELLSTPTKEA